MVGRLDFVCFALPFRDARKDKKQSTLVDHFIEFFLDSGSIPDISTDNATRPQRAVVALSVEMSEVSTHFACGYRRALRYL